MESLNELIDTVVNNLLRPAIMILIPLILFKLQSMATKSTTSTVDKNEKESLAAIASLVTQATEQIRKAVSAAVAANMRLANMLKKDESAELTDSEIELLNTNARTLTYKMLPETITKGAMLVLLGGTEGLDAMIDSMMERELISIKAEIGTYTISQ